MEQQTGIPTRIGFSITRSRRLQSAGCPNG